MHLSDQRNKGVAEMITVPLGDVVVALFLGSFAAAVWWEWYTDPKRPTKRGR